MDATIIEAVSQVGFPIAAAIGIFFLYNRSLKDFTEALTEIKGMLGELSTLVRSLDNHMNKKVNSAEGEES